MSTAMYGERLVGQAALDVLMEATERLASAQSEGAVAAVVRIAARRLTGADGISVVLKKGDRVHYVDEDAIGPLWKGQDFPIEACISGWAIKNAETVVISDISGDPRIPLAAYQPTFVKSLVMAPVGLPNPMASVGAYWATKRRATDDEVHALETVARLASVALENVRLRRELADALVRAQAADRAKSAFLASMSRNVRAPLTNLATLAEMLERGQTDARQRQLAGVLSASAEDAAQIIADILEFARIDGEGALHPAPFDLVAAIRVAAAPHITQAKRRGLILDIDIAPRISGLYMGDGARVQKVVDLLVANAVKTTERGGVMVRLQEIERVGVRSFFKLSVTDTGAGVEDIAAHNALGLAMADAIARAMGGELSAVATRGAGRTVTVRFPLDLPMDDVTERRLAI